MRTVRLTLSAILVFACGSVAGGPLPAVNLADYVAPAGAKWCGLPAGGVATLEGRNGPVLLWDAAGRPAGAIEVTEVPAGATPMQPTASQTQIALLWRSFNDQLVVQLFSLATRARIRQLTFPSFAVTVTLGPDTLVMEDLTVDSAAPMQVLDLKGNRLATYPLPTELVKSVEAATGSTWLAHMRTFFHGRELWGVAGGDYELWHLGKTSSRVEVAAERRVRGNYLTGEVATRRYEERGVPPGPRRANAIVEPAVRQVSPTGSQVAFLLEDQPAAESGRCRVDFWDFPGPKPGTSIRIPGPCPDAVYQGERGLWLRRQGRIKWQPLPATQP